MKSYEAEQRKRFEALVLLTGGKNISVPRVQELTGLRPAAIVSLREKYLLARLCGIDVATIIAMHHKDIVASKIPIETQIDLLIVENLLKADKLNEIRIILCGAGSLRKLMGIQVESIEHIDREAIINGLRSIYEKDGK